MARPEDYLAEVSTGFTATRALLREALQFDRESHALTAVLSARLDALQRQVEHLNRVVEQGNGRPGLSVQVQSLQQELAELQRWREGRAHWTAVLERVQAEVGELKRGALPPEAHVELIKGRWGFYGLLVTAASGVALGVLHFFVK